MSGLVRCCPVCVVSFSIVISSEGEGSGCLALSSFRNVCYVVIICFLFLLVPFEGYGLRLSLFLRIYFIIEPRHEKTCLRSLRPVNTQTGMRSYRD